MLIPISWFCFIIVTSVWTELILYFPPYAGEQRLWVWVGHWHRDHTKAGQVHVWQPGKWRHQLCHTGGASDPAAGEHPLFHTAPYCWEIKHDWCVFLFFFLPPARRERLPWSSKASTTRERQSAPGTHTQTHTKQMLLVSFAQKWIEVVVGWCKCCRRTGGEAPCWWEWGAITSCPPITFRCSTAQVSFASQPLSLTLGGNANWNSLCCFFSLQLRTRRAAAPSPGRPKTPACSLWTRRLWSTTLHLTRGQYLNKLPTAADPNSNI